MMWTCPKCERKFKSPHQSHTCGVATLDDLFLGKPDELVLAFDTLMRTVLDWSPCTVGAAKSCAVFTNQKAWLIVRPMAKQLDIKFYYDEMIDHPRLHRVKHFFSNYAHHVRISDEESIDQELLELLRVGYDFANE